MGEVRAVRLSATDETQIEDPNHGMSLHRPISTQHNFLLPIREEPISVHDHPGPSTSCVGDSLRDKVDHYRKR
jgi:hypothetical protein